MRKGLLVSLVFLSACGSSAGTAQSPLPPSETKVVDLSGVATALSSTFDGTTVTLVPKSDHDGSVLIELDAVVQLDGLKPTVVELGLGPAYYPTAIWIGRLTSDATAASAVLTHHTGGNACCSTLTVVQPSFGTIKVTRLARYSGDDTRVLEDLNGDGTYDFVISDPGLSRHFFHSGAGRWSVPRVVNVVEGSVVDISHDPRLAKFWGDYAEKAKGVCAGRDREDNLLVCVAYTAAMARLGKFEEGFDYIEPIVRNSEGPFEFCSYDVSPALCIPEARERVFSFEGAVRRALSEQGYIQ